MKKLLIPVIIAVLAGVGGGSGFAYMRVSKAHLADSLQRVDSLKAHPPADSASHDGARHDASADTATHDTASTHAESGGTPIEETLPMTPADSIRAIAASRKPLQAATKGVPDAAAHLPAETVHDTASSAGHASGTKPKGSTSVVADIVREARNEAMTTTLPEQRLAKIFAAMSAKDAAKVMEQMPDADVRSILALMNDRTAAAVLSQFSATRAAAITKGALRASGGTP